MPVLGGAAVLAAVVWRLGVGPFVDGLTMVDGSALIAAAGITLFTTVCSAWRWCLVARGIGLELRMRAAIAAYYRSQLLNSVLPGAVLGDVARGVDHGLSSGEVGRGLRAVAAERVGGHIVQVICALAVLALVPSPVRSSLPFLAAIAALVVVGAVIVFCALPAGGPSIWARAIRTSATDFRHGLLARGTWPGVVSASCAAMAGHVAIFLIAAQTAGVTISPIRMLPLAVLVLLAMSVPMNVAGWGPREGVAAWAFATAGLGASLGVTVAVVYGVLALVACLPGAVVLVVGRHRRRIRGVHPADSKRSLRSTVVNEGTVARG